MTGAEVTEVIVRRLLCEAGTPPNSVLAEIGGDMVRQIARDIVASGASALLVDGGNAIMCLQCGMVSHNVNDVAQRYCGSCHRFHAM